MGGPQLKAEPEAPGDPLSQAPGMPRLNVLNPNPGHLVALTEVGFGGIEGNSADCVGACYCVLGACQVWILFLQEEGGTDLYRRKKEKIRNEWRTTEVTTVVHLNAPRIKDKSSMKLTFLVKEGAGALIVQFVRLLSPQSYHSIQLIL